MPIILEQFTHPSLSFSRFTVQRGQAWSIYGGNSSGTETLLRLLAKTLRNYSAERLELPEKIGFLTAQRQQELFEKELANDDSDFLDHPDPGTLVREFLPGRAVTSGIIQALDMEDCLDTGYRQLSSGQNRKLLFLTEIFSDAEYLVLENPFDGLDQKSRHQMEKILEEEMLAGRTLLLFVTNRGDIGKWCSHLALFHHGKLFYQGKMPEKNQLDPLLSSIQDNGNQQQGFDFSEKKQRQELISLKNGFASYGDKQLFSGVNLRIESGDHTLVTGSNGCGKSTLFNIITGDNPKCYSNELRLFGRKRGSGESIWEIKNRMGIVSPTLHREHRGVGTALQVVLSGLFDSIGLYTKATRSEIAQAQKWLRWTGLVENAQTPFSHLDYGKQRLILIARALVKEPELLMLDEPTQGLDEQHRKQLLDFLEKVAGQHGTTIFYISHRTDEYRSFFEQRICLERYLVSLPKEINQRGKNRQTEDYPITPGMS